MYFFAANETMRDPGSAITEPFFRVLIPEIITFLYFLIFEGTSTRLISLFFESAPDVLTYVTLIFFYTAIFDIIGLFVK